MLESCRRCCAEDSEEAAKIALRCQELLHQPRAGEQVAGSWGSGAGLVLEETRAAMSRLLKVLRTCLVRRSLTAIPFLTCICPGMGVNRGASGCLRHGLPWHACS